MGREGEEGDGRTARRRGRRRTKARTIGGEGDVITATMSSRGSITELEDGDAAAGDVVVVGEMNDALPLAPHHARPAVRLRRRRTRTMRCRSCDDRRRRLAATYVTSKPRFGRLTRGRCQPSQRGAATEVESPPQLVRTREFEGPRSRAMEAYARFPTLLDWIGVRSRARWIVVGHAADRALGAARR